MNIWDLFTTDEEASSAHRECHNLAKGFDGASQSEQVYADCLAEKVWESSFESLFKTEEFNGNIDSVDSS
jgi:hypothetical protein